MKPFFTALLALSLALGAKAQQPVEDVPPTRLTREELKELAGPIALYPDPLVALILPASTFPGDLVLAARFVDSGADPDLADAKSWDDSVKGLVRYPDTLKWLDENLDWTTQLGDAYMAQPEDVMDAIQDLRAQAQSLGNLATTPQQRVVEDEERIRIVPADPEIIYVPVYQPEIVYYERPVAQPLLTFSLGYLVGSWLRYDFDWHHRRLYCGDWQRHDWDYHHDHDRDRRSGDVRINNYMTNYQVWNVDTRRHSAAVNRVSVTVQRGVANRQSSPQTLVGRQTDPKRDGDHSQFDHHGSRFVLPKPTLNLAVAKGHEGVVQRAVEANETRTFKPGSATNSRSGDQKDKDHDGKGHFVMPRSDAPMISADGRRGDSDKSKSDSKSHTQGDNKPDIRRAEPVRPDIKDFLPGGKPHVPVIVGGDRRGDKDKSKADPQSRVQQTDKPEIHRGQPMRPDIKDFVPTGKPNGISGGGGSNRGDSGKGSGDTPKPRIDVTKPQVVMPVHRETTKPQVSPPLHRETPKPQVLPPVHRETPKPQVSPPMHRETPKLQVSPPVHRETPKPQVSPPVHRETPKPQAHSNSSRDKDDDDKRKKH